MDKNSIGLIEEMAKLIVRSTICSKNLKDYYLTSFRMMLIIFAALQNA